MRTLVKHAVGGGWGFDEHEEGTNQVAVIRGADFPAVALGDTSRVPVRWETVRKIPQRQLEVGDIVLEISGGTSDRPTGRTIFMSERLLESFECPAIPASFCRLVRIDEALADPYYVYWWLQAMYAEGRTWSYQNRSTGIANFQFEHFLDTEVVHLPAAEVQREIAATLGSFDDKIESNQRVRLLAWELLSAEYEQLTVGSEEVELRALLQLEYGKSLPSAVRTSGSVPVYGSNGVTGAHDRELISGPGVIVGRKGSIGEVHWSHLPSFPIDTTFYVVPQEDYPMLACYFALKSADLTSKNSDSAVPGLNRDAALGSRVFAPDARASQEWARSRAPLLEYLHHCDQEIERLKAVRQKLLPALLSGRMQVREAEGVLA